jgi:prepilin-type N-terminal cleavage/methylation domain-containing protein
MKARGFSLLECLIALALSLFVVCACLGFFGAAQKSYFRLKDKEEAAQSALAALDKMRVDILRAGQELVLAATLGFVDPVAEASGGLVVTRSEQTYSLAADAAAGDSKISLTSVAGLKAAREVWLSDREKGEVCVIASVSAGAVTVATPLSRPYPKDGASVQLLERISLSLDARQGVLRRRVNLSPAQPLLESVRSAEFFVDRTANLVRVRFSLVTQGDAAYEINLFPKNPALAGRS